MSNIRVLLVDDHPIVRTGIRNLLDESVGIEVVGEASRGSQVVDLVRELEPHVLVLDMELPDIPGTEVVDQIRSENLPVRILVLSGYAEPVFIRALLNQGISGYLIKDEALDEIEDAVRGVARGEKGWFSQKVSARITEILTNEEHGGEMMTGREKDVLNELSKGKSNQEIGDALGISDKTVEKHMEAIFNKLGMHSRVEAAVWGVEHGYG